MSYAEDLQRRIDARVGPGEYDVEWWLDAVTRGFLNDPSHVARTRWVKWKRTKSPELMAELTRRIERMKAAPR